MELENRNYRVHSPVIDFIQVERQLDSTSVGSFYISVKLKLEICFSQGLCLTLKELENLFDLKKCGKVHQTEPIACI